MAGRKGSCLPHAWWPSEAWEAAVAQPEKPQRQAVVPWQRKKEEEEEARREEARRETARRRQVAVVRLPLWPPPPMAWRP